MMHPTPFVRDQRVGSRGLLCLIEFAISGLGIGYRWLRERKRCLWMVLSCAVADLVLEVDLDLPYLRPIRSLAGVHLALGLLGLDPSVGT